jgi:hypothetical protein
MSAFYPERLPRDTSACVIRGQTFSTDDQEMLVPIRVAAIINK